MINSHNDAAGVGEVLDRTAFRHELWAGDDDKVPITFLFKKRSDALCCTDRHSALDNI